MQVLRGRDVSERRPAWARRPHGSRRGVLDGQRAISTVGPREPRACGPARGPEARAVVRPAAPRARGRRPPRARPRGRAHLVDRDRTAELARDRRERRVLEPAGGDPLRERRRVEVDVERVAVRRHPARDVDADRGDLARRPRQPDAGQALDPLAVERERAERPDQRLLEVAARSASRRARAGSGRGSGSRRAGPGRGRWTCRRGRSRRPRPRRRRARAARRSSVRRPSVTTGGCSSRTPCPGSRPARRRRRASAGAPRPRGTARAPRLSRYALRLMPAA